MNDYWREFSMRCRKASLLTPCEKCSATVGEECRTAGGNAVLFPHKKRRARARSAVFAEDAALARRVPRTKS